MPSGVFLLRLFSAQYSPLWRCLGHICLGCSATLSFKKGKSQRSYDARSDTELRPLSVGTGIFVEKEDVLNGGDWTPAAGIFVEKEDVLSGGDWTLAADLLANLFLHNMTI